mmetsp:Transcript_18689/g.47736  ORF Transcript_18689/g.47736 Transcript_18689/m.47736 type:complete len:228 (+) Transcript_18689:1519-2202(+)
MQMSSASNHLWHGAGRLSPCPSEEISETEKEPCSSSLAACCSVKGPPGGGGGAALLPVLSRSSRSSGSSCSSSTTRRQCRYTPLKRTQDESRPSSCSLSAARDGTLSTLENMALHALCAEAGPSAFTPATSSETARVQPASGSGPCALTSSAWSSARSTLKCSLRALSAPYSCAMDATHSSSLQKAVAHALSSSAACTPTILQTPRTISPRQPSIGSTLLSTKCLRR